MMYANMEEIRQRKKSAFEGMAEKMAEFFSTNGFLKIFSKISDILSFILTAVALAVSILILIGMGGYSALGSALPTLSFTVVTFGFLAMSKKTLLPLAIALSEVAAIYLTTLIVGLVTFAQFYWTAMSVVGYVFSFIFAVVDIALMVTLAIIAWMNFAAMLGPKQYQPQPMYAQPAPQQPVAPAPVAPAPAAPVPAQAAPAPAQVGVCPACGIANEPGSAFCKGCGTKL